MYPMKFCIPTHTIICILTNIVYRRWKGAGGVVAAGFLGNDWQIDEETAFLQRYFSSDHVVPRY